MVLILDIVYKIILDIEYIIKYKKCENLSVGIFLPVTPLFLVSQRTIRTNRNIFIMVHGITISVPWYHHSKRLSLPQIT